MGTVSLHYKGKNETEYRLMSQGDLAIKTYTQKLDKLCEANMVAYIGEAIFVTKEAEEYKLVYFDSSDEAEIRCSLANQKISAINCIFGLRGNR